LNLYLRDIEDIETGSPIEVWFGSGCPNEKALSDYFKWNKKMAVMLPAN